MRTLTLVWLLQRERHVDTRGWSASRLSLTGARWEQLGDEAGPPLARFCYKIAERYRMKAYITGTVLRGERDR